jgi:multidrug efflux pump subunit AcrB
LNFGLPAPVDVQIEGQDQATNHELANRVLGELRRVPGVTDLRIQQPFDYPMFNINVDRTEAAIGGYTDRDVTGSLLVALSGSFQTTPNFFLNWNNGVQYELISQTPQYRIQSLQGVGNIPLTSATMVRPEILSEVASLRRGNEMEAISHYNIRRVIDIYGSVQDRDLASVGRPLVALSTTTANSSRGAASFLYAANLRRCAPHTQNCWPAWPPRSFSSIC